MILLCGGDCLPLDFGLLCGFLGRAVRERVATLALHGAEVHDK